MREIVLLAFLCSFFTIKSQTIVDTSKTWNVLHFYNNWAWTYTYKFTEDTIIEDTTYYILKYSRTEYFNEKEALTVAFFREKEGIVYIKYHNTPSYVLYNFNAENCDTVKLGFVNQVSELEFIVESVDYDMYDSLQRKRMYVLPKNNFATKPQYWIEGVGSSLGLVEVAEMQKFNYNTRLLCMKENGIIKWQNKEGYCYYSNLQNDKTIAMKKDEDELNSTFELNIIENREDLLLKIFDKKGALVVTKKIKKKSQNTFYEDLPAGNYIVQLSDMKGIVLKMKEMKL